MGKICQILIELSACDTIGVGDYHFMFFLLINVLSESFLCLTLYHFFPGICEIFASILKDHGIIWTRLPLEGIPAEINNGPKVDFMKEVHLQAQQAKGVFTRHGLK